MTAAPLFIESIGLASPLGLTADSSYAALRAKMDRFQTLPYRDDAGAALTGSCLQSLGEPRAAKDRWLPLLSHAVRDALPGLRSRSSQHFLPNGWLWQ